MNLPDKQLLKQLLAGLATACTLLAASMAVSAPAAAADLPTFRLELKDGKMIPQRIEVPAGVKIKIEVFNTGTSPAEFESVQLRKEKVLSPGTNSFVVIAPMQPGEYKFFDDFHPAAGEGVIVVK